MDVDEFWIIFLCNLVWIIRSVRPWCRYCPALCCRYRGSQGEVFFCHSQKQSGLLPHLQMECILPNKLLECKTLDTYSHLQTSPGLWIWIQSESTTGAKSTWLWWTPSTRIIAYHGERLHWATEVTLLQEKTVESSSLVKLLSIWTTSLSLRL